MDGLPDLRLPWRTTDYHESRRKIVDCSSLSVLVISSGAWSVEEDSQIAEYITRLVNLALPPAALARTDTLAGILRAALADMDDRARLAALADHIVVDVLGGDVGYRWTDAAPTEKGWYWWRLIPKGGEKIFEVFESPSRDGVLMAWDAERRFSFNFSELGGQWSDRPVRRPGEGS